MIYYDCFNSIIGNIYVVMKDNSLHNIFLSEEHWKKFNCHSEELVENKEKCKEAIEQLREYFDGNRKDFTISFDLKGTDFQKSVWKELMKIPFGKTRSYSDIATALGKEKAVRAIGQANKANPLPIIIPCHRVVSKNGSLCGYMGSRTDIKAKLLGLEGVL